MLQKFALMSLVLLVCGTIPVSAQSEREVMTRVDQLERQLRAVQRRIFDGDLGPDNTATGTGNSVVGVSDRRLIADMAAKLGLLEEQLRNLTGRLEEIEFRQRQVGQDIEVLRREMELRFSSQQSDNIQDANQTNATIAAQTDSVIPGNTGVPAANNDVPDNNTETIPEVRLPEDGNAETRYNYAFDFIRQNDLERGQAAMTLFMEAHPESPLSGNAKFWLGRIYLQKGEVSQAARYFYAVAEEYGDHEKRPEALVNLAEALIGLEASEDACITLQEFGRYAESASPRLNNRVERLTEQAGCTG